jgi:glyoxylase-like metal-dependent hydrolase (beta-lactamase superfamily II)
MREVVPGIWHWRAVHENTGWPAHSHLDVRSRTVFDPMLPETGLGWFEGERRPERIVLSCRHHLRHAPALMEAFGCPLLCHHDGLHEFEGSDVRAEGYAWGDELAPGVTAVEVGALSPDETAIHVATPGALLTADGVLREGDDGPLGFMPDGLMGDDPEGVKRGLRAAFLRLTGELDWDALLMAHGQPRASGGRAELRAFAEA